MPLAAKASALAAIKTPQKGGETELADMRDAYDTLSETMKEKIARAICLPFPLSKPSESWIQIQYG